MKKKKEIQGVNIFTFIKVLRNIATHHSILSGVNGKFPRPVSRIVSIGTAQNAEFRIVPEKLEFIFSEILIERPREKKTIDIARLFLNEQISLGGDILLKDILQSAVHAVERHVS